MKSSNKLTHTFQKDNNKIKELALGQVCKSQCLRFVWEGGFRAVMLTDGLFACEKNGCDIVRKSF